MGLFREILDAAFHRKRHQATRRKSFISPLRKTSMERLEDRSLFAVNLDAGLLAHWTLNETSGTTAGDSAGNFAAAITSGSGFDFAQGQFENGLHLSGSSGTRLSAPQGLVNAVGAFDSLSVTMWMKVPSIGGDTLTVDYRDTSPAGSQNRTAKLFVQDRNYGGAAGIANRPSSDAAEWVHFAFVYGGSEWHLYRNGIEVSHQFEPINSRISHTTELTGLYFQNQYGGIDLDEVRVYDRALWEDEVAALAYNPASQAPLPPALVPDASLLSHWKLDESSGSIAVDSSGTNNGVLQDDSKFVAARVNRGVQLDGAGDFIALGAANSLPTSGKIALSAWIKPGAIDGLRDIIAHGYSLSPYGEVFLRINNGQYQVGSWDGADHLTSATIPAGDLGQWVHLVGQYDGEKWELLRNGVSIASTPSTTGAVPVGGDWAIGSRGGGSERFFQGVIDDVRVYDGPLTSGQIAGMLQQVGSVPVLADRTLVLPAVPVANAVVGKLSARDDDAGDVHTYTILGGDAAAAFSVSAGGDITLVSPTTLDFEVQPTYALLVQVEDAAGHTDQATVTLVSAASLVVSLPTVASQNENYSIILDNAGITTLAFQINWGDGMIETPPLGTTVVSHKYQAPSSFPVSVSAGDIAGFTEIVAPQLVIVEQRPGVNLARNGDFELPAIDDSSWQLFKGPVGREVITGWRVGKGFGAEVQRGLFPISDASSPNASNPQNQYVELDADEDGPAGPFRPAEHGSSGLTSTVNVIPGRAYAISFDYRGRPGTGIYDNVVKTVVTDGVSEQTKQYPADDLTAWSDPAEWSRLTSGWKTFTQYFLASSNQILISLEDMGPSFGTDNALGSFIDNVKVAYDDSDIISLAVDSNNDNVISESDNSLVGIGAANPTRLELSTVLTAGPQWSFVIDAVSGAQNIKLWSDIARQNPIALGTTWLQSPPTELFVEGLQAGTTLLSLRAYASNGSFSNSFIEETAQVEVVGVDGYMLDVADGGQWVTVGADEALFTTDTVRRIPTGLPSWSENLVESIEWLKSPAEGPSSWLPFDATNAFAYQESGTQLGDWLIRPVVRFRGGAESTFLAAGDGTIEISREEVYRPSVDWVKATDNFQAGVAGVDTGDKLFPEKRLPGNRETNQQYKDYFDKIYVRLSLDRPLNRKAASAGVVLKVFDPDNETSIADLDTNGEAPDDNIGSGRFRKPASAGWTAGTLTESGTISNSQKFTDADGVEHPYFQSILVVTADPSDNYIVVGGRASYVNAATFKGGLGLNSQMEWPATPGKPGKVDVPASNKTHLLQIWRTLYIETDTMAAPTENDLTGGESPSWIVSGGASRMGAAGSKDIQIDRPISLQSPMQFAGGFITLLDAEFNKIGTYRVVASGIGDTPKITIDQAVPDNVAKFTNLVDDDLVMPAGEDTYKPRVTDLTPKLDWLARELEKVYIKVVTDRADLRADSDQSVNETIPFSLELGTGGDLDSDGFATDAFGILGSHRQAANEAGFWSITIVGAYQGSRKDDGDVGTLQGGVTFSHLMGVAMGKPIAGEGTTSGIFIFRETIRDRLAINPAYSLPAASISEENLLRAVALHEVGHMLGAEHEDGDVMDYDSILNLQPEDVQLFGFSGKSLRKIIERRFPPGQAGVTK